MEEIQVKVKKMPHGQPDLPYYATPGSAGMDLSACLPEPLKILAGERRTIPTGIALQIPHAGMVGLIFPRSGLAARLGINLANSVGVIDSDYTGEILCVLANHGQDEVVIRPGDRIAQILFIPVFRAVLEEVKELIETDRGTGGFGSTGTNHRSKDRGNDQ